MDFPVPVASFDESFSWEFFFESRSVIQTKAIKAIKSINASIREIVSSNIMIANMIAAMVAIGMSLLTVAR